MRSVPHGDCCFSTSARARSRCSYGGLPFGGNSRRRLTGWQRRCRKLCECMACGAHLLRMNNLTAFLMPESSRTRQELLGTIRHHRAESARKIVTTCRGEPDYTGSETHLPAAFTSGPEATTLSEANVRSAHSAHISGCEAHMAFR